MRTIEAVLTTPSAVQPAPVGSRRVLWLATSLAAVPLAVPVLLFAIWGVRNPSPPERPTYALELECDHCQRGATLCLHRSAVMQVTLRPATQITEDLQVRAAQRDKTGLLPWKIEAMRSSAGTFRFVASVQSLPRRSPGLSHLLFLIGDKQDLASSIEQSPPGGPRVQVLSQAIEVAPENKSTSGLHCSPRTDS